MTTTPTADERFSVPLYTLTEAAQYLGVPPSTFGNWARGYVVPESAQRAKAVVGRPVLTVIADQPKTSASVPFIGLAEGLVLAAIRSSGVPMQRVRPAIDRLRDEFGIEHVLASRALYTDGAELLYRFTHDGDGGSVSDVDVTIDSLGTTSGSSPKPSHLVVARNGQYVFNEIVQGYLRRIDFGDDGYAEKIDLPGYQTAEVVANPRQGFGQPIFLRGGAKVEDVLGMFWAGESLSVVSDEYGVPLDQLEDALRVANRFRLAA